MIFSAANRRPTFFWQAALIVLPVIVLAAVGLISLRQDRVLAELDSKQSAQFIADFLSQQIFDWLRLGDNAAHPGKFIPLPNPTGDEVIVFKTSSTGELIDPPPLAELPTPAPFDLERLNAEQARLWHAARAAEFGVASTNAVIEAYEQFLASEPPEPFAASAIFSLGLLFAEQRNDAATNQFARIVSEHPDAVGESGLALAPLARLKEFQLILSDTNRPLDERAAALTSLCSNLVAQPTLLSASLLERATRVESSLGLINRVAAYRRKWDAHQFARRLHAAARPQLAASAALLRNTTQSTNGPQFTSLMVANGTATVVREKVAAEAPRRFWFAVREAVPSSPTNFPTLRAHAVTNPEEFWLATVFHDELGAGFVWCQPERILRSTIDTLIRSAVVPSDYFGIEVTLAGRSLTDAADLRVWRWANYFGRGGGGQKREFLEPQTTPAAVLATSRKFAGNNEILSVNVRLTSPDALFARQRARTFWFGSVIALAAVAALIGLVAAWRAFVRQQRLNEMKSNFVSSVSHELRAPIASVRLLAEGLDSGRVREPAKQNEYFRFIVQECRRLSSLIENVLDFSRIEQGRKEYEFEPTNAVALVESTVKLMNAAATERGVKLTTQIALPENVRANLHPLLDGRAIQQALVNLIDNALKHSPAGETVVVGLEITSCSTSKNLVTNQTAPASGVSTFNVHPSTLNLSVEDHGPGIPPEDHERIFERFYRRGSELRRETQGVGLGLAIVKHIVEAHGGKVIVRSAVSEGSRFTLELPLVDGAAENVSTSTEQV